jgi:heme A synthase
MPERAEMSTFAKFAWFALAYNVLVIVWGVFLRASKSGDGCGQFWLTCNGELIPSAPQFKTVIEFSHRMTTALDGVVMLILLGWAIRRWYAGRTVQNRQILYAAIGSMFFVVTEAAVGAGLVLTGNTAEAITDTRALWSIGHLVNTFILLTFLTLTAWFATGERRIDFRPGAKVWLLIGGAVVGLLLVGSSGSLAALSNMLFPSQSISEGIAKDFSPASNLILRLRLSHPVLSILTSVYIIFIAGWLKATVPEDANTAWWSKVVSIITMVQVAFGGATLLTLGPIVMQLGHLLLADLLWISFVLLVANFLAAKARNLP